MDGRGAGGDRLRDRCGKLRDMFGKLRDWC